MRAEELKEPLRHFEKELKSTVDEVKSGVSSVGKPATPGTASASKSEDSDAGN